MKYKNKEYKTIIWDWKSTLYDDFNSKLFDWVISVFKKLDTQNYLVSWSSDYQKRLELINSFGIKAYFKEISISLTSKREIFEKIFDSQGVDPETTLVVGDNMNDEIRIARDMGVDATHVSEFVSEVVNKEK